MTAKRPLPGHEPIEKADEAARKRDPHGTGPLDAEGEGDAKARPTNDRSETETAASDDGRP